MKKKNLRRIILILIIVLISLFIILKTKLEKNEIQNNISVDNSYKNTVVNEDKDYKGDSKIKYLKYSEENGYTMSGGYYEISVDEQIIAEDYSLSQETSKYEKIKSQIWSKEKWNSFEKELYGMGLENWSEKVEEKEETEGKIIIDKHPLDGTSYNLTVIFRDNSEMKLSGYWTVEFDISEILYKYFKE